MKIKLLVVLSALLFFNVLLSQNSGTWSALGSGSTTTWSTSTGSVNITASATNYGSGTGYTLNDFTTSETMGCAGAYSEPTIGGNPALSIRHTFPNTASITFNFSHLVVNPVIHFDRLGGGQVNNLTSSSLISIVTPGITFTELSQNDVHFVSTATTVGRHAGQIYTGLPSECGPASNGTAAGSLRLNGVFNTVTFEISMDASGSTSSVNDRWELAFSNVVVADPCDAVATGNLDTDNDGVSDICDLDDDNDGILDVDEATICRSTPSVMPNSTLTATASGSGASGIPSVSYQVPDGTNRMMLTIITVERDHSLAPYGDNHESNYHITGNASDRLDISYGGVLIPLNRLRHDFLNAGTVANQGAIHSSTTYIYAMFEDDIPSGNNNFDFSEFILPNNAGDEFSIIVTTFENVSHLEFINRNSFPVSASPTWTLSGDALAVTQNAGTTEDQNLLFTYGSIGTQSGITPSSGWSTVASIINSNNNGTVTTDSNFPGFTSENDGMSSGLYTLSGVTGTQSITLTSNFSSTVILHQQILMYRLVGFAISDSDNDGIANCVDIDSDNDGIPDNVEAQPTVGYIAPTGTINPEGVYPVYSAGLSLEDTDGDGIQDFIDLDTDNDGTPDIQENGDVNLLSNLDTDNDGLDNSFDAITTVFDCNDEVTIGTIVDLTSSFGDFDGDASTGGDLDYRDIFEVNPPSSATLDFDGVDDYLSSGEVLDFSNSNFTISAWIRLDTNVGNMAIMGRSNGYTTPNLNTRGISLEVQGGSGFNAPYLHFVVFNGLTKIDIKTPNRDISKNNWTHVTASYDGVQIRLYVDGELKHTEALVSTLLPDLTDIDFTIGAIFSSQDTATRHHFDGAIDEVRVFNTKLSDDQIKQMVYQEIEENNSYVRGAVIPKDIQDRGNNSKVLWSTLEAYYPMTDIQSSKISDYSSNSNTAILHNINTYQAQTAPMPYQSVSNGNWTEENTWLHGNVWGIDNDDDDNSNVANNETNESFIKEWSIIRISHNIKTNSSMKCLGLVVDANKTLTIKGTNQIENNWYLELNGTIDLKNDSQLIQTNTSDLVTSNQGKLLRRQEGQSSLYRYNYWSSPVGTPAATVLLNENALTNNTNNTPFTLSMLKNASGASIPFTSSPYNTDGVLSSYWLYTYQNGVSYYDWDAIEPTTPLVSGLGYTQKGGGSLSKYLFEGKPNNGTILLSATDVGGLGSIAGISKTQYLVGNPYPSAIDAHQFIIDNSLTTTGTIYLWEQWAGDSHNLNAYEGGYATLNLLGQTKAYQFIGIEGQGLGLQDGLKTPTRYLPVGQGFMVEVIGTGDIKFNNGQRVFKTDTTGDTIFFRTGNTSETTSTTTEVDTIQKIKLEFKTSTDLGRELILGFSNQTTSDGFDYGYDALATETFANDLTMTLESKPMVIQAFSQITSDKVIDLNFKADGIVTYSIKTTDIINIPDNQPVYLLDNQTGSYHDLKSGLEYNFTSLAGEFNNRFDIVFQDPNALSNETFNLEADNTSIYFSHTQELLFVKGLQQEVKLATLYNAIGQEVFKSTTVTKTQLENGLQLANLSTGMYVVSIKTENNKSLDKKIIIE